MKNFTLHFLTLIIIGAFNLSSFGQCTNANFSNCNFTGWQGTHSRNATTAPTEPNPFAIPGLLTGPLNQAANVQNPYGVQFIMTSGFDPIIGGTTLPVTDPLSTSQCSARLGSNDASTGLTGGGGTLLYKWTVTAANPNFAYDYAVVMDGATTSHTPAQMPYFKIYMWYYTSATDSTLITCDTFNVNSNDAAAIGGFTALSSNPDVLYRPWSTVFIPLIPYIGKQVSIQFEVRDCCFLCPTPSAGTHYCYAYINTNCSPQPLTPANPILCSTAGSEVSITASAGAQTYAWTGPSIVSGGDNQTVVVNGPGTYTVSMTSFGSGCPYTTTVTVTKSAGAVNPSVTSETICLGKSATLTASGDGPYKWVIPQTCPSTTSTYSTTGSYSYTVPAGIGSLTVQAWGGGGGGGNGGGTLTTGGGGGGGGGYGSSTFTVTPGTVYTVTVGAGGAGSATTGATGGSSSFGTIITSNGGGGGGQGSFSILGSGGGAGGAGGTSTGTSNLTGGSGSPTSAATGGAGGAGANGGAGGTGGSASATSGNNGAGLGGGGGGGGETATTGGNGAAGEVIITASCSPFLVYDTTATMTTTPTVVGISTYTVNGGSASCYGTSTASITVLPNPTATFTTQSVCAGAPSTITYTGTAPNTSVFTWNFAGGTVLSGSGEGPYTVSWPSSGTKKVSVFVNNGGCSATDTVPTVINPLPVVTASSAVVCPGGSAILQASGATTYTWSTGATTTTITATPAATTTYTVTGNSLGCLGTGKGTITVSPIPVITATSTTICTGQATGTITANGAISCLNTATQTYSVSGTGTFVLPISSSQSPSITVQVWGAGGGGGAGGTTGAAGSGGGGGGAGGYSSSTFTVVPGTTYNLSVGAGGTGGASAAGGVGGDSWFGSATTVLAKGGSGGGLGISGTVNSTATGGAGGGAASGIGTITFSGGSGGASASICISGGGGGESGGSSGTGGIGSNCANGGGDNDPGGSGVNDGGGTSGDGGAGATNLAAGGAGFGPGGGGGGAGFENNTGGAGAVGQVTITYNVCSGSYLWSTGATTTSITASPTVATTYTVTGKSAAGCISSGTGTISLNPLPVVTSTSATVCNGITGTITASGANTYLWSTGATTAAITATPTVTTTYTVTGTSLGCTDIATGVINVNPLPVVSANTTTICDGQGPAGTLTASGANSYTWSTGSAMATMTASPTATTTYTVTGTTLGCTGTGTGTITVNPLPVVTATSATICPTLSATLTASGANSYTWSTGAATTTMTATPTVTSTYTVTGTLLGCTGTGTGAIVIQNHLSITVTTATICNGQGPAGILTATGGATYVWSTGAATNTMTAAPSANATYTVTGTNSGCTGVGTGTIIVNPLPVVASTSTSVCIGNAATLTASGANSYTWSTGAATATMTASPPSTATYTVTGNSLGCVNTTTGTINIVLAPVVTVSPATICAGQTASITAVGAPTYIWNTAATNDPLIVTPANTTTYTVTGAGCPNSSTGTVTVNPLPVVSATSTTICDGQGPAGTLTASGANSYTWSTGAATGTLTIAPTTTTTYTVTGSTLGCTDTATGIITVNPLPVVTSSSKTVCAGSTTTLTAAGANSYTWSTGAATNTITASPTSTTTYTVTGNSLGCTGTATGTITDNVAPILSATSATICIGQTATLTITGADTYTCITTGTTGSSIVQSPALTTVYTINGQTTGITCLGTTTATITVNPLPVVSATSTTICDGQGPAGTLTASGANSYVWSDGEVTNVVILAPTSTSTYTVTGSTLGCTGTATGVITVNPLPPVTASSTTICDGQGPAGTLTASGANSYTWSTGAATNTIIASPTSTATYTVTGNSLGCVSTATGVITVNPLPPVTASSTTICDGQGPAGTLTASGANSYTWSTGAATNTIIASPTSTTTYTVTGNTLGCVNVATGVITVNPLPVVSATSTTICDGQGPAGTLTASGANSYTWSTGAAINSITVGPTSTTTYTVTGSTLGCTGSATGVITVNPIPVVTVTSDTVCRGLAATLTAAGANSYIWSTGAATNTITASPVFSTQYIVTGNSLGCLSTATGTITIVLAPTVVVVPATICAGQTSKLTAYGAKSYTWSNGSTKNPLSVTPAATTTYTVYGAGCPNSATGTVMVNPLPIVSVSSDTICDGQSATIYAKGANSYHWANGSTASSLTASPNITTTYSVVGTSLGCSQTASGTIVINPLPAIKVNNDTICPNGIAVLTASGASTYLWSTGSTNTSITVSLAKTTAYSVTGKTMFGCIKSGTGKVVVTPFPIANFIESPNPTNVFDTEIAFLNKSSEDVVYWHWNFGDGDTLSPNTTNPIHIYGDKAGSYTVTLIVHNSTPCWDTTSQVIAIGPAYAFYIPNSFTPNGDGINDGFGGKGIGIVNYQLWIFDRWGNFIWSADALNEQWDGRANGGANIAQEDVYVWKVFITDVFGDTHALMGTVTLIR